MLGSILTSPVTPHVDPPVWFLTLSQHRNRKIPNDFLCTADCGLPSVLIFLDSSAAVKRSGHLFKFCNGFFVVNDSANVLN